MKCKNYNMSQKILLISNFKQPKYTPKLWTGTLKCEKRGRMHHFGIHAANTLNKLEESKCEEEMLYIVTVSSLCLRAHARACVRQFPIKMT